MITSIFMLLTDTNLMSNENLLLDYESFSNYNNDSLGEANNNIVYNIISDVHHGSVFKIAHKK